MNIVHKRAIVCEDLDWYVQQLADEGPTAPKVLIFCG
jgi:hypothetical protein